MANLIVVRSIAGYPASCRLVGVRLRKMADSQMSLEQQEQVLGNNRDFIVKHLDADDVIDELIQEKLIGQNAAQRVELLGTSRVEKNRIIFDQLITCGPTALEKFCEILRRKKRQSFIAEQLEKCEYMKINKFTHDIAGNRYG